MKTITIHSHPSYWGSDATDSQAAQWALKMGGCAEAAGFTHDCTEAGGTTDEAEIYSLNYEPDARDEGEIDWFARWCSHGFRGMVAWLKMEAAK